MQWEDWMPELEQLRQQTCFCLQLMAPELGDASSLVDECFSDAQKYFKDTFICQFRPEAWAKITLTYHKHFLDTGCDVSIAEIVAVVVRDAIGTNRMDFLTLNLAQQKQLDAAHSDASDHEQDKDCPLSLVKKQP
ncbi:hypothetical protein ACFVYJ_02485 [Pontibacter sp. JAM-7]|uniref:hypothetical protein n=1 Tax=Pontibacter sp. JAM-7 TaxID=3366581 RepID=UPI003AF512A8